MRKPDDPTACTDTESGEQPSLYARWSRRKHLARTGRAPSEASDPDPRESHPASIEAVDHEPSAALEEPPVLTDEDMPALETLGEDDDYSGFMSPGVSEALRAKALRKLFMSSKYNVVDGLNDYDDDFTSFERLGDIVTSDMRHRIELEAEKATAEAQEQARAALAREARDGPALEDGGHAVSEGKGEGEERVEEPAGQDAASLRDAEPAGDDGEALAQASGGVTGGSEGLRRDG